LTFKRETVFCLGHRLSKHKLQDMLEILGGGPFAPWLRLCWACCSVCA